MSAVPIVPNEIAARIKSHHLGNERSVWIRPPRQSDARDLVIFLDGELYREKVGALDVVEALLDRGEIADAWFVFVSMESVEARWRECPCYAPFARFIVEELLPWLKERFPPIARVQQRTLAGLSYTGLAAAYAEWAQPGVFHKIISQSGSFWWNDCWLTRQFHDLPPRAKADFFLDVGRRETQVNVQHREDVLQVVSQIEGVQRFRAALLAAGYAVTYVEFDGAHEFASWRTALPAALRWALPCQRPFSSE